MDQIQDLFETLNITGSSKSNLRILTSLEFKCEPIHFEKNKRIFLSELKNFKKRTGNIFWEGILSTSPHREKTFENDQSETAESYPKISLENDQFKVVAPDPETTLERDHSEESRKKVSSCKNLSTDDHVQETEERTPKLEVPKKFLFKVNTSLWSFEDTLYFLRMNLETFRKDDIELCGAEVKIEHLRDGIPLEKEVRDTILKHKSSDSKLKIHVTQLSTLKGESTEVRMKYRFDESNVFLTVSTFETLGDFLREEGPYFYELVPQPVGPLEQ